MIHGVSGWYQVTSRQKRPSPSPHTRASSNPARAYTQNEKTNNTCGHDDPSSTVAIGGLEVGQQWQPRATPAENLMWESHTSFTDIADLLKHSDAQSSDSGRRLIPAASEQPGPLPGGCMVTAGELQVAPGVQS